MGAEIIAEGMAFGLEGVGVGTGIGFELERVAGLVEITICPEIFFDVFDMYMYVPGLAFRGIRICVLLP